MHGEDTRHQDRSPAARGSRVRWDQAIWRRFARPPAHADGHAAADDAAPHGVPDEDDTREGDIEAFAVLIEALPDGIALIAADGFVIAANPLSREWLGLAADGSDDGILGIRFNALPELFAKEKRWFRRTTRCLAPYGTLAIIRDVTIEARQVERIEALEQDAETAQTELSRAGATIAALEERLGRERARAEAASHAMSEFMANASHELRTPLNAVLGFSELMTRELFGPLGHEKYTEYVRDIHASGAAMLDLVTDILDMARLDGPDGSVLQPARMRLADAVKTCVGLVRHRIDSKFQELTVDLERLPTAYADVQSVKRILLHLLTNAIKFTPEHGSITLRGRADLHHVILTVEDTGIGIDPEDLAQLGSPFRRSKRATVNGAPGLGLGLALSHRLAEANGGNLTLSSVPDRGTIARLILPRRAKRSGTRAPQTEHVSDAASVRAVS